MRAIFVRQIQGDSVEMGVTQSSPETTLQHDGKPGFFCQPTLLLRNILVLEICGPGRREEKIYPLWKEVTNIGRHVTNDIVINECIVSNFHLQIRREGEQCVLFHPHPERQKTVNGLYHDGYEYHGEEAFQKQLVSGDRFEIGDKQVLCVTLTYYEREASSTTLPDQQRTHEDSAGIRIDARHLTKMSNQGVTLLNAISLTIPERTLVALVGGSGTGKSTLMDALTGLRPAQEGQVLYNGLDYYHHRALFRKQLGYVPQDDIVHRDLTVQRALYYSAKIRLGSEMTNEQIQQRINEVLDDVEMQEQRHLLISKLSGGQRKRVSIALELLAKPKIFFLDEPTSGLDPGLDYRMMHLLRKLADRGQTIVLVTHATSNIMLCDYICFLTYGGRLAYFGPPDDARRYFGKNDFAAIYSLLEPGTKGHDIPEQVETRFKASTDYQRYVIAPMHEGTDKQEQLSQWRIDEKSKQRNGWRQLLFLSLRYIELLKNDPGNVLILLLQAPIIALFIIVLMKYEIGTGIFAPSSIVRCPTTRTILNATGAPDIPGPLDKVIATSCQRVATFLQDDPRGKLYAARRGGAHAALQDFIVTGSGTNAQKILFIMGFSAVLFGCVNAAREIVKEAPIYRRERALGLGIIPYMFSKILVLILLCLVQSTILVGLITLFDPFQQGIWLPALIEVYITITLTSLAGLMMGLAVSAIASSTDRAMSFIPILLIPQVIFSGTVFPFKDWFIQLLAMVFAARWSIGALGTTSGLHSDKLGGDSLLGTTAIYHGTLFSLYGQQDALHHLFTMWLALCAMILLFICIIGWCLKRKDNG